MEYLLPTVLALVSYLLGVYFAHQGLRSVIDRPLAYRNENVTLALTVIFGWVPLFVALYLGYKGSGWLFALGLLVVRFVLLPTLLNDPIKKFMDKKGI